MRASLLVPLLSLSLFFSLSRGMWPFDGAYQATVDGMEVKARERKDSLMVGAGRMKDCAQKVYEKLDQSCAGMDNDQNIRFASLLAICHLRATRRSGSDYRDCDPKESAVDCSSRFTTEDKSTFDLFFLHVKDMCVVAEQYHFKEKLSLLVNGLVDESERARGDFRELREGIRLSRDELQEAKETLGRDVASVGEGVRFVRADLEHNVELSKTLTRSVGGVASSLSEFRDKSLGQLSELAGGLDVLREGQTRVQEKVNGVDDKLGEQAKAMDELRNRAQESLELLQDVLHAVKSIKNIQQQLKDDFTGWRGLVFYFSTLIAVFLFTSTPATAIARIPLVFWTLGMAGGYKWGYFDDGWEHYARVFHLLVCGIALALVAWFVPTDEARIHKEVKHLRQDLMRAALARENAGTI